MIEGILTIVVSFLLPGGADGPSDSIAGAGVGELGFVFAKADPAKSVSPPLVEFKGETGGATGLTGGGAGAPTGVGEGGAFGLSGSFALGTIPNGTFSPGAFAEIMAVFCPASTTAFGVTPLLRRILITGFLTLPRPDGSCVAIIYYSVFKRKKVSKPITL